MQRCANTGARVLRAAGCALGTHLAEFFGLFKRFEITLSSGGNFEGKAFSFPDY